jgi:hypothetical protein
MVPLPYFGRDNLFSGGFYHTVGFRCQVSGIRKKTWSKENLSPVTYAEKISFDKAQIVCTLNIMIISPEEI